MRDSSAATPAMRTAADSWASCVLAVMIRCCRFSVRQCRSVCRRASVTPRNARDAAMRAAIAATRVASTDDSPNTLGVASVAAVVVFTGLIISDDAALVGKRSPQGLPTRIWPTTFVLRSGQAETADMPPDHWCVYRMPYTFRPEGDVRRAPAEHSPQRKP